MMLPSAPLLNVLDNRAKRYVKEGGSFQPANGNPKGIGGLCNEISRRSGYDAESIRRWITDARSKGVIRFDRADVICVAISTDAIALWPVEWTQDWDEEIEEVML